MGCKPNMPEVKIRNIYELQSLDISEDPRDLRILKYNLCSECDERSKKCTQCKSGAKQCTIAEKQEYDMIASSVEPVVINDQRFLRCNYPIMGNPEQLYHASLSNRHAALAKYKALFRKLH